MKDSGLMHHIRVSVANDQPCDLLQALQGLRSQHKSEKVKINEVKTHDNGIAQR